MRDRTRGSSMVRTVALAVMAAGGCLADGVYNYTWVGGSSGTWQDGFNWDVQSAPVGSYSPIPTSSVYIPTGNTVTVGYGALNTWAAAGSLTIGSGSQVVVPSSQNVSYGGLYLQVASSLNNAGDILVGGSNGGGQLLTGASLGYASYQGATLTGGGTITLSNGGQLTVPNYGIGDQGVTLANQTVQGNGLIAETNLTIQGAGKIDANTAGATLLMDAAGPTNGVVVNNGIMQASNGGTLQLGSGHWNGSALWVTQGAGGVIRALGGSLVQLGYSNADGYDPPGSITGGTLSTSGSGRIDARDSFLLNGVTNSGNLHAVYTGVSTANGLQLANGIHNTGTITLDSAGISVVSGGATLTGGGTVTLGGNAVTGGALTNVDNTIRGAGSLAVTTLTNQAVIDSNQAGANLAIYGGGTVQNSGVLQASNGGTLQLGEGHWSGGPIYVQQSAGGVVRALDGSVVQLGYNNAGDYDPPGSITGGTLSTSGSGRIDARDSFLLDGVTNTGNLHVLYNGASTANGLQLANGIHNTGTITLDTAGISVVNGGATLTGGGTLPLGGNGIGGGPLTNADHTIQGAGAITVSTLTNQGVINANQAGGTLVFYGGGTVQNSGILEASNGGTMQFGRGHWDGGAIFVQQSAGGVIRALDGSVVQLGYNNPGAYDLPGSITGGMLSTSGSGRIEVRDYFLLNGVTNSGNLHVLYNGPSTANGMQLAGTIQNTGTISMDSANISIADAGVTLTGTGTVNLGGYRIAGGLLTNAGNTIQGSGSIDWLNNQGTVRVAAGDGIGVFTLANVSGGTLSGGTYDLAGTLAISGQVSNNAASIILDGPSAILSYAGSNALAGFANNLAAGSFTLRNGRNFTTAGDFANAGAMDIGAGSTFQVGPNGSPGKYTQTGGSTKLNGTLTAGTMDIEGGSFSGSGTLNADLLVKGTLSPGNSPGTMTVYGDYEQDASGTLAIEVAMALADLVNVHGDITLGGILQIIAYGNWQGRVDDHFQILDWTGTRTGDFAQVILPSLTGYHFSTEWGDQGLWVNVAGDGPTAGAVPEPGTFFLLGFALLVGGYKLRRKQ